MARAGKDRASTSATKGGGAGSSRTASNDPKSPPGGGATIAGTRPGDDGPGSGGGGGDTVTAKPGKGAGAKTKGGGFKFKALKPGNLWYREHAFVGGYLEVDASTAELMRASSSHGVDFEEVTE